MSKPGKVLKELCKKLGVRLTVKRGKKRVYKSVAVLKKQCANKKKKKVKKKVKRKRRRKFGTGKRNWTEMGNPELNPRYYKYIKLLHDNDNSISKSFYKKEFYNYLVAFTKKNIDYLREREPRWLQKLHNLGMRDFIWVKIKPRYDLKEGMVLRNCRLTFEPDEDTITGVDFTGSTLLNFNVWGTLNNCTFDDCNLRHCDISAQILNCSFRGADLTGTDFIESEMISYFRRSQQRTITTLEHFFEGAIYNTKEVALNGTVYDDHGRYLHEDEGYLVQPTRFSQDLADYGITPSSISTMEEDNEDDADDNCERLRWYKGYQDRSYSIGEEDDEWFVGNFINKNGEELIWDGNAWVLMNSPADKSGSFYEDVDMEEDDDMGGVTESKGDNFGKKRKRKVKKKVKRKRKVEKKVKRKRKVEKKVKRKRKVEKKVKRKKRVKRKRKK